MEHNAPTSVHSAPVCGVNFAMKIHDKIISYLKDEVIDIERRTDITDDQKVSRIIRLFSAVCAGVAVQPIPFADFFILTPIQAFMGTRIAAIRGVPIKQSDALTLLKELTGVIGLGYLAQQLAIGAYKTG